MNEFSSSREVEQKFHVDESDDVQGSLSYDIIIGLELMEELGLIIKCQTKIVEQDDLRTAMKNCMTQFNQKHLRVLLEIIREPKITHTKQSRCIKTRDTKYKKS